MEELLSDNSERAEYIVTVGKSKELYVIDKDSFYGEGEFELPIINDYLKLIYNLLKIQTDFNKKDKAQQLFLFDYENKEYLRYDNFLTSYPKDKACDSLETRGGEQVNMEDKEYFFMKKNASVTKKVKIHPLRRWLLRLPP